MQNHSIKSLDGKVVRPGQTYTIDHAVSKFTLTVRSMNTVTAETIRRMIERGYEVVNVEEVERTTYVHPFQIPDFPA